MDVLKTILTNLKTLIETSKVYDSYLVKLPSPLNEGAFISILIIAAIFVGIIALVVSLFKNNRKEEKQPKIKKTKKEAVMAKTTKKDKKQINNADLKISREYFEYLS